MSRGSIDLIGFVLCSGAAAVWGVIVPEKIHGVLLLGAVVCFIRWNRRTPDRVETPEETLKRISVTMYKQGLEHGLQKGQAHADGANASVHRLPRVG